jgi:hypothetical protein
MPIFIVGRRPSGRIEGLQKSTEGGESRMTIVKVIAIVAVAAASLSLGACASKPKPAPVSASYSK